MRRVGAYAKLLANYASDDAIIAAGESAELLFVRGLAFCATSDSDGFITDGQLVRVVGSGMRDAEKRASVLVREGLWEREADGYQVRSWLKIHDAAEEKGRKRRTDRERKRREREDGQAEESERSPSGIRADNGPPSERNPEDVTPDSLLCSYVSSTGSTEQSMTEQSTTSEPRTSARARFDEFWDQYPRREAKRAAVEAFVRASKRADVEKILDGARRYRDDPNREPAYTALPTTWLNQDRWTDDPLPTRALRAVAPQQPRRPAGWEFGMGD